ncbi:MAG: hypothetical protein DRI90_16175, partial [Deltaproteobacteria bacterium]
DPSPASEPPAWEAEDAGWEPAEVPSDHAASAGALDLRDQTPTLPPGGEKGKRHDTEPISEPDAGGTYSFVAPRSRRKKRPR